MSTDDGAADASRPLTSLDAGTTPPVLRGDASSTPPVTPYDAGAPRYDATTPVVNIPPVTTPPRPDGGPGIGDIFGDLGDLFKVDDAGMGHVNADAGFTPPPDGGGAWSLNDDSFADCPEEPPPIPIVGGLCTGIYFGCGWTNASGATYSCVCDWVHWLCI